MTPFLLTVTAPAVAVIAAHPRCSRRTIRAKSAARRLLDRGGVLDLGMKSCRARCHGLRIGGNRHHSQRERCYRQRHRELLHKTLLLVGPIMPNRTRSLQRSDTTLCGLASSMP